MRHPGSRHTTFLFCVLSPIFLILNFAAFPLHAEPSLCAGQEENELLGLMNSARREAGLAPLLCHEELQSIAHDHVGLMCTHGILSAQFGENFNLFDAVLNLDLESSSIKACFAGGRPTAQIAFERWMQSGIQRAKILSSATHVGLGYQHCPSSRYRTYWSAVFVEAPNEIAPGRCSRAGNALDTNGDGTVSPIDALMILNFINQPEASEEAMEIFRGLCLDVNDDGFISPIDALFVLNELNL